MPRWFLFTLLCFAPGGLSGQSSTPSTPPPPGIQDNSFLVEEAYNQEEGVVQHISNFTRLWQSKSWAYTFTQEWPVDPHPRHQLSYTIPVVNPGDLAGAGIGDVALNYRYQLVGNGSAKVAFAPRFTVLLPTGDYRSNHGAGGAGVQLSLPLSVVVNRKLVTHWNVGTTLVPSARDPLGDHAATYGYNLGQSFIWRVHPRFNAMLETVWAGSEPVVGPGRTARQHSLLINPGIRWAYNFPSGLQIVPGIAVPLGVGPSAGEKGIFVYLSIEHPFGKRKK